MDREQQQRRFKNVAAAMGGMGFIERFRVECLRSILINTHMVEAAYRAGAQRYFFSSSACAYNTLLQQDPNVRALKESDAYPAMAERGYGWEKLISEQFCQEYWHERGLKMNRKYDLHAPQGVAGRNSDNTLIKKVLKWEPNTKLDKGLTVTYAWIAEQYHARKAGKRVGIG